MCVFPSGPAGPAQVALQHQPFAAEPATSDEGGRRRGRQGQMTTVILCCVDFFFFSRHQGPSNLIALRFTEYIPVTVLITCVR